MRLNCYMHVGKPLKHEISLLALSCRLSESFYVLKSGSVIKTIIGKPKRRLRRVKTKQIVSAHRRILGMASVVCVLIKICVSSISLYKLDPDKLTTPFESAHQFTLVCTVSDSKTVPGCNYHPCSKSQFCSD